jgi:microcompartment protein CcmL/EutN
VPDALALVETRGLVAAIEAADAMVKAAAVELIAIRRVDPALCTVLARGETSAAQTAVLAGAEAAARVGDLVSSRLIARPAPGIAEAAAQPLPPAKRSQVIG